MTLTRDILRLLAAVNDRRRGDVSLSALSALAHRSPFNLHRRFRQAVGETPKAYTSRVRLARAAAELLSTDRATSAIALDHGFGSHEVFTRAFTRHFGVSPRTYRARGLHVDDDRAAAVHAATVSAVAPCVGLYRRTTTERNPPVPVDIVVKELPVTYALIMRRRIAREEVAATLGEFLPVLFAYAQRHGLAMSGPPFARYPEIGMGSLVIEGGVQLAAPAPHEPGDGIEALTIPAGPAAVAIHHGPYERLPETYQVIESWIQDEGRSAAGPPREIYLTDPGERPDPETWETEIIQPLT
ncbi:helix-turn-helix domain-containing protein [Actinomadura craniellae]|uniref:helix-turn-helix domain-containing protein n=1 Tax=Actinomadura craniellae TaxID=2231787 RepID=UPI001313DA2C|nr:helix-turn-helix domain-containing protein [Actinomadura craniellae]